MIQDIAPKKFDNQFSGRRPPKQEDLLLIYRKNQILTCASEANVIRYPRAGILLAAGDETLETAAGIYLVGGCHLIYLFSIDETAFYSIDEAAEVEQLLAGHGGSRVMADEVLEDMTFVSFQVFRTGVPGYLAFAGITGSQLYRWRMDHRFSGCCGVKMKTSDKERAFICPECGATSYPKICPAVIVAVTHKDKILVSRYAGRGNTPSFALIAGFAEFGETIEDTVHREVMEEVGIRVKNLRFYKSQPWSFSDTLLMGFYCELDGEDAITLDREELAMAAWLSREKLPVRANEISLTAEMMENFRVGKA